MTDLTTLIERLEAGETSREDKAQVSETAQLLRDGADILEVRYRPDVLMDTPDGLAMRV